MTQKPKLYASQEDIKEIKSMTREKLEEYAIMMLDSYLDQKQQIDALHQVVKWHMDYLATKEA